MNAKVETPEYRLDLVKWLVVIALVAAGVIANSYYAELPLWYRVPALLVAGIVALLIATQTAKGAATLALLRESVVEVRRVVWPTRPETNQTTLIVVAVVVVMAFLLWLLDSSLGFLASLILG
ncbi:preprotein translocase subunit SecE [Aurantivibrio plasticivorans]